ncbi:MAG: peptidoglycan-binding protein, partial [Deltaproteobacteria bacterium]|nr:peptidoglycan-binding protein [Deltaproteobacteria bacterium]
DPGPVNGINGPQTKKAIMEFQRDQEIAVDGIPGPQTLKSLGL